MSRARLLGAAAPILLIAVAGCASTKTDAASAETLGETVPFASDEERAAADRLDPLARASFWSQEYGKDPSDAPTALRFAEALKAINSHKRITEILTPVAATNPENAEVLMALGRAHLAIDQLEPAVNAFGRAAEVEPERPDAYAAAGLAYDRGQRHDVAQIAYRKALELDPARAATRSNLGLSLALSGDLPGAEAELRAAADLPAADVRVRQNLALVLGLQGKFEEMRKIAEVDAPQRLLESNEAVLRRLIGPTRRWEDLSDEPFPQDEGGASPGFASPGLRGQQGAS